MQKKNTHWFRTTLLVMVACTILGICISIVRFLRNPNALTYASSQIQFAFDGAASGIAPNGYQFDINDIFTKDVIGEALKSSGFDSRYTVDQIYDQLSIEGDYPGDINEQMMNYESILDFNANRPVSLNKYHPTLFTVKLYNEFDKSISKADLESLLHSITSLATSYFSKIYSSSIESNELDINLEGYDYSQQLTILIRSINRTLSYAKDLYEKDSSFTYQGYGFNDIVVRLEDLLNNEIDRLNASIVISALSKDDERLLLYYQYELDSLKIDLTNKQDCLAKLENLKNSYEKNDIIYLSSADSWTKIDGNASKTYDALVAEHKAVADDITDINSKIEQYMLLMNDLMNNKTGHSTPFAAEIENGENTVQLSNEEIEERSERIAQNTALLEKDILYVSETHQKIKADFSDLIKAYNGANINEKTVQVIPNRFSSPSLISAEFLISAFKTVAPLCALGFMVCMVLIMIDRKKEQKIMQ